MSTPILHYFPGNASLAPHIVLAEAGARFELQRVDREHDEHKSPAYLKLNPNGLIPLYVDGDLVLYESAAICLHVADTHPKADLLPALGTADRAQAYKWMAWMTNTLQATLIHYFYPDRMVDAGNAEGAAQVRRHAEVRIGSLLDQLEAQLASHGGPWLLGQAYSACDPYALMLCRWTRGFGRPARSLPLLGAYLQRTLARPAVQRVYASEGITAPLV
jgi:glutathione S-transferase